MSTANCHNIVASENAEENVKDTEAIDGHRQKTRRRRRKRGKKHKSDLTVNSKQKEMDSGLLNVQEITTSNNVHSETITPNTLPSHASTYNTSSESNVADHVNSAFEDQKNCYRGDDEDIQQSKTPKSDGVQFRGKVKGQVANHERPAITDDGDDLPRINSNRDGRQTRETGKVGHQKNDHLSKKKKKTLFEEYWSKEKALAALKRGEVHKGTLRISPKNFEIAWVSLQGYRRDIAILGMVPRNRALDGDVVAVKILAKENWKIMHDEMKYYEDLVDYTVENLSNVQVTSVEENNYKKSNYGAFPKKKSKTDVNEVPEQYLQMTAKIVYIIEKKHTRIVCGYLRPMTDRSDPDGLFSPTDSRLPRLRIAHNDCPPQFFDRPQDFETTFMIARLTEWHRDAPLDSFFAQGVLERSLGEAGEIEPETDGILSINDIDSSPFTEEVLNCLPKEIPWKISQEEIKSRRDFRDICVFTIDPATARDLDDGLHCIKLDDGCFEVGVHIADVSFFVKEGTSLDKVACLRATSTYMVQKVIPMLPRMLCEELCSLNPNEDRLTFSVVWKMDHNGNILDEWMGKGIIRSRAKLSYKHAQEIIDNPEKVWRNEEHPSLECGATIASIVEPVCYLQNIAEKLRYRRFENGTLRLDKAKISFDLDGETGLPVGWHRYVQRESNKLIEEYMLLANMAVAHRIYKAFPDRAILRCHPKPDARQLEEIHSLCNSLGLCFAYESSKEIQETLNTFPPNSPEHLVLSHLSMKPMKAAKYFCASEDGSPDEFLHYALSVTLYTHFTSPIRRYPDIIVHRLLAACLEVESAPQFTSEELGAIAGHCNGKRLAAKKAGEASVELYLGAFVRECGPLTEDGIIVDVMHESVDVLVPDFGIIKRVYFKFSDAVHSYDFQEGHKTRAAKVLITWNGAQDKRKVDEDQKGEMRDTHNGKKTRSKERDHHHRSTDVLTIFTRVRVLLKTEKDKTKNKGGLKFCGELLQNDITE